MFKRYSKSPIISPKDIISSHPEMIDVSSVFNPGGIQFDNKILLLLRVQNRGRETLTVKATSDDGIHFSIDNQPVIFSGMDNFDEIVFHIYDPRITKIENTYFVMAAMDVVGKCLLGLFTTKDFYSLEFLGIKGEEDNRNGVLFPEKINGKYTSFDRPNKSLVESGVTTGNAIWYSESDDLIKWESKKLVMEGRLHYWDEYIGALSGAFAFFVITNFGVWIVGGYEKSIYGLIMCYIAAIPFYKGTLLGTFFYTPIFFGFYYLLQKKLDVLKSKHILY